MPKTVFRRVAAACAFATAAVTIPVPAQTQTTNAPLPTVSWYVTTGFQPYFVLSGPDEGNGVMDRATRMLMDGMPQYRHKSVEAALPRILDALKNQTVTSCAGSLYRTKEREAAMDFSAPYLYLMPNGIIGLRKHADSFKPFLDDQGNLRLDDFLANGKLKLALARERSYGATVDPMLKRHEANTVSVAATDTFSSLLLKLANHNEFDAIIGYAIELRYTTKDLKLDPRDFVVYPVAGSADVLPLSVSCSRTEDGHKVLAAIDRMLADVSNRQRLDGFYRDWLDAESAAYYDRSVQRVRGGK